MVDQQPLLSSHMSERVQENGSDDNIQNTSNEVMLHNNGTTLKKV